MTVHCTLMIDVGEGGGIVYSLLATVIARAILYRLRVRNDTRAGYDG